MVTSDSWTSEQFIEYMKSGKKPSEQKPKTKNKAILSTYKEQEYIYTITDELCSLNEYINAERTNRFIASSIKKKMTDICIKSCSCLLDTDIDKNGLYDVFCQWNVTNNKKDSDNVFFGIKFILDGLVKGGVLKGDGRKNIRHISHSIFTKDDYSVTIKLKRCN